jgi:hypothetical protein
MKGCCWRFRGRLMADVRNLDPHLAAKSIGAKNLSLSIELVSGTSHAYYRFFLQPARFFNT